MKLDVVNTWDGNIDSEWKKLVLDDKMLEQAIKQYVVNYYLGISVLDGGGDLLEIWDDIEEFLIFKGYTIVVKQDKSPRGYFFCEIFEEDYTLLGKENLTVIDIEDDAKPKIKLIEGGKPNPEYKWVIFENNRQRTPLLPGVIDYFISKIINVVRKMEIDLFTSERRVMMVVGQQPAEEDVDYLVSTFQNIFFTFIAMQHSRNPTKEQAGLGLTGIHPSQMGEPVFIEPKRDQRGDYWRDYIYWLRELEKFLGIRNDPLHDKEERASTIEVKASTATYGAFERRGWKARDRGIKNWCTTFKESNSNYQLTYGEYDGTIKK